MSKIQFENCDCVMVNSSQRLNMEYDMKRKPHSACDHPELHNHLAFSTAPWSSFDEYTKYHDLWTKFHSTSLKCLKSTDDLKAFLVYCDSGVAIPEAKRRYLSGKDGDLKRLRQVLCSARAAGLMGLNEPTESREGVKTVLIRTNAQFAKLLSMLGLETKRSDVENGRKKSFEANMCSPTQRCLDIVEELRRFYPDLDSTQLFPNVRDRNGLTLSDHCSYILQIQQERLDYDEEVPDMRLPTVSQHEGAWLSESIANEAMLYSAS